MLFAISGLTNASVTASGTIEGVTATQFGYFKAGLVYVNVHTAQVPSGEVRGDLVVGNVGGGQLSARNMVPAGSSNASGTLAVRFLSSGAVWYSLSVAGIDVGSAQLVGPASATVASTSTLFTISAFTASAVTGVFHAEGTWTGLTSQQIQWLAANLVFASVRSVDGSTTIRTQIVGLAACGMMYGYADLLAQVWAAEGGRWGMWMEMDEDEQYFLTICFERLTLVACCFTHSCWCAWGRVLFLPADGSCSGGKRDGRLRLEPVRGIAAVLGDSGRPVRASDCVAHARPVGPAWDQREPDDLLQQPDWRNIGAGHGGGDDGQHECHAGGHHLLCGEAKPPCSRLFSRGLA